MQARLIKEWHPNGLRCDTLKKTLGIYKMRGAIAFLLTAACLLGGPAELKRAEDLYNRTDYRASLTLLQELPSPEAAAYSLIGQNHFMLGEYKKATDAFQKAVALAPKNSEYAHWLGRTYGRRAETSGPFMAPMHASRARQYFEIAVALDPRNEEALNDLFAYYLQAPASLGGGFDKAAALAKRIAAINPAEGHFAQAQLADKHKEFDSAEQQLRRAMELAPRQAARGRGRAKYLANDGSL